MYIFMQLCSPSSDTTVGCGVGLGMKHSMVVSFNGSSSPGLLLGNHTLLMQKPVVIFGNNDSRSSSFPGAKLTDA